MNPWNAKHACAARLAQAMASAALLSMANAMPGSAAVPSNGLVARYDFNGDARDASGRGHQGILHSVNPTSNRFGKGSSAYSFNGTNAYIEISDHRDFSLATTGKLSISLWIRPGTLTFPDTEGTGYVHWMGKGVTNQHEWALRMYSSDNTEGRGNRTSFYLFNLTGGLGAGSYVQEGVAPGTWYHYVAVMDMSTDTIKWYKNGVLRDQDSFINSEFHINARDGTALVRIGTKDFASYFKGAIDNVAIYNRALSASEVVQLYNDTTP
jgi:Concanavalin A-like lectin/glucanases superfamily